MDREKLGVDRKLAIVVRQYAWAGSAEERQLEEHADMINCSH